MRTTSHSLDTQPNRTHAPVCWIYIPALQVNLGELATYDQAKRTVMNLTGYSDGLATHTLSALFSGFFAALCSTPADVCKTRVMAGVYPTMVTCLVGTVRKEGPRALWKGFLPNWLRLGPWQFCFWITYEELRFRTTGEGF
jgi:solute carrier family 25 uncoupling protein 27